MPSVGIQLNLSKEEILRLYRGHARRVHCVAFDGRSIQFPANVLRPFITHSGVHGRFTLTFDEQNHFVSITRDT